MTYPSMRIAAEALGVRRETIWRAAKEGRLDQVGLPASGRNAIPLRINGVAHASIAEACGVWGLGRRTVVRLLDAQGPDINLDIGRTRSRRVSLRMRADDWRALDAITADDGYTGMAELLQELALDFIAERRARRSG